MAEDNSQSVRRLSAAPGAVLVGPAPLVPLVGAQAAFAALRGAIGREIEERRPFAVLPIAVAAGILLFFVSDGRATLWAPVAAAIACGLAAVGVRRHFLPFCLLVGGAFLFAGFAAAVLRTASVAAPTLERIIIAPLGGFIEAVEARPQG